MQPILRINLTTNKVEQIDIPGDVEREYIGGASMAAHLLYPYLTADLEPLSPAAPLLFLNGPLTGTSGPAVGRFIVAARSPATRLWGESNCGGFWGPELRMAGYDGLWLSGKADHPVYLWIQDGHVEVRPADHLWGLETYQTQTAIESELNAGKVRVAVIGPAGEALLPIAGVLTDHGRVAGRTGMGAVMGSKNLKAIAVKGHKRVPVFDFKGYSKVRSEFNRFLRDDPQTQVAHELGSASVADYMDYLGLMPKKYYQTDVFEGATGISGANMAETILVGTSACHACVIACGRVVRLGDGDKRKGPEYETLVGFGPNLWLDDPAFATRMGELCDRYGMDSISVSNTIGLVLKLFETGRITVEDTGGMSLSWGDKAVVEQLVHQTGRREGLGFWIGQGARALGRHFGAEGEAMHVNGLETPYHDPRGGSGMALSYATSPRGACHNQSDYFMVEIGQVETSLGIAYLSRQDGAGKAANVARHQDWRSVYNSLVICYFANVPPETVLELVNLACGQTYQLDDLLRIGERSWNLKRAINLRLGLRRQDDRLPKGFMIPYAPGGGTESYIPPIAEMLDAYYAARGWDPQDGFPRPEKLVELRLEHVAKDLTSLKEAEAGSMGGSR